VKDPVEVRKLLIEKNKELGEDDSKRDPIGRTVRNNKTQTLGREI